MVYEIPALRDGSDHFDFPSVSVFVKPKELRKILAFRPKSGVIPAMPSIQHIIARKLGMPLEDTVIDNRIIFQKGRLSYATTKLYY